MSLKTAKMSWRAVAVRFTGFIPLLHALTAPARWFGRIVRLLPTLLLSLSALLLVPAGAALALRTPQPTPLQEVAPPAGAQAVRDALGDRQPRISIVAPENDALLTASDWTLTLRVQDWPVHEPGNLGPGPHVVVQLDDAPGQRLFSGPAEGDLWTITIPALAPGSHRLTAYAAWPWGEPVVGPGALDQHRLHRTARSAHGLPAPQAVQLLPAPPPALAAGAPVPVSWLLIDAPLQNLRPDDARWRLQIGVDGTTILLDRNEPFWLAPLPPGLHALTLDLLDAQGAPLGAPFTSHVVELAVPPRGAPLPAVLRPQLTGRELESLLAEAPPAADVIADAENEAPDVDAERPHDDRHDKRDNEQKDNDPEDKNRDNKDQDNNAQNDNAQDDKDQNDNGGKAAAIPDGNGIQEPADTQEAGGDTVVDDPQAPEPAPEDA